MQAGVGDFGVVKVEVFEAGQILEMIESGITDPGVFKVQFGEVFHRRHSFEAGIGDFGAGEVERGDLVRDGYERFEAGVGEVFGDIESGEAPGFAISGHGHEQGAGGVDLVGGRFHGRVGGCGLGLEGTGQQGEGEEGVDRAHKGDWGKGFVRTRSDLS